MPRDMLKGERLTAAAVIPGDSQGHLEQPEQATKPRECLWPLENLVVFELKFKKTAGLYCLFFASAKHTFSVHGPQLSTLVAVVN